MTEPRIGRFMMGAPHSLSQRHTLADARRALNQLGVGHLPVLEAGKLVGVISERDLCFIETLKDVDRGALSVSEAMSQNTFVTGPRTSVKEVVAEMTEHSYDSVVIFEAGRVIGLLTTRDALRAISTLLEEQGSS